VDVQSFDNAATPLILAAFAANIEAVEALLDNGADPTVGNDFGLTALHFAAEVPETEEVMRLLTDAGLSVDIQSTFGTTPLEHASYYGNEDGVRFLLDAGADPALGNGDGVFDDPCGCLEVIGDPEQRQCAEGACETPQQKATIEQLMGRGDAGTATPAASGTNDVPSIQTVDCSSLPTVLQKLECTAATGAG